jgi:poly(3-hydroxybutyrate) depolymerase
MILSWTSLLISTVFCLEGLDHVLPPLGANPDTITISGYSTGAYMAQAMTIIFSETIKGCGEVGGGPYTFDWHMPKDDGQVVVLQ